MTAKKTANDGFKLKKVYDVRDSLAAIEQRVQKELKRDAETYRKDPIASKPTNSPPC